MVGHDNWAQDSLSGSPMYAESKQNNDKLDKKYRLLKY